jgi:demethylmacrocin O-methyltransferase
MPETDELSLLATKYGSDKWGPHGYTKHYDAHFARFRHKAINLLEIGIGGYDDPTKGGASLRMWHDYFPAGRVFALDIFDKRLQLSDRVKIYQGSQADAQVLRCIFEDAGGFDIIIDDGSHINAHVIASFEVLFPLLNSGGLYVVEDTQTSYWPALGGSSDDPDSLNTIMGFFKDLVHGLNHAEFIGKSNRKSHFECHIVSVPFYHNMVFVEKGDNSEPSNIPETDPLRRA